MNRISKTLQRAFFYIFIQLVALWNIFILLTSTNQTIKMDLIGTILLTAIFLFYGHKTIQLLKNSTRDEGVKQIL